jgi:peptide deformylase
MKENQTLVINTDSWKEDLKTTTIEVKIEIFDLVPENSEILKQKLPEFDFSNPPVNPNSFASSLVETCKKHNGLGLSANQCGFNYRVFVMGMDDNYVAFFNPKVIEVSEETMKMEEGCLSFKDLFLHIERPKTIKVEYQDFNGQTRQSMFTGLTARCFLHELDHMNGIVYHTYVKPLSLKMAEKRRVGLKLKRKQIEKHIAKKVKEQENANRHRNLGQ